MKLLSLGFYLGLVSMGCITNATDSGEDDMPRITGQQSLANNMAVGVQQPVNSLQIGLAEPDGQLISGTMTISFSVQPPAAAPAGSPPPFIAGVFDCEAIINWVIGNNRTTRRITIGQGTSISGVGEGATVQLVDQTLASPTVPVGTVYSVDVQAAVGTRGSIAFLPTLQLQSQMSQVIAPSGSGTFQIPQNAGVIGAIVYVDYVEASPTFHAVGQYSNPRGDTLTSFDADITPETRVPPQATELAIGNRDTVNAITVSIVWLIDG